MQATIAGDFQGGYRDQLEKFIKKEGLQDCVNFVGRLERKTLARFYALHHVGIFPSVHPEAFGIVAAEMMASGLAVVSSCGWSWELVEHEKTATPGNQGELADCLARLAEDSDLRNLLAFARKKQVEEKFSVEKQRLLEEVSIIPRKTC